VLSLAALDLRAGLARSGTMTIAVRHLGLVLALAAIAPLLASSLPDAADRALLKATAVVLDAPVGLTKKVPVALDLRKAIDEANTGERPDLKAAFDAHGAKSDPKLAAARDDVVAAIEATVTRAFRPAFLICAGLAAAALALAFVMRGRRWE
jgi:hypothetical protein